MFSLQAPEQLTLYVSRTSVNDDANSNVFASAVTGHHYVIKITGGRDQTYIAHDGLWSLDFMTHAQSAQTCDLFVEVGLGDQFCDNILICAIL